MTLIQSIILGIVQGLGEFLPISSSGHLVLASALLGQEVSEGSLIFNVLLHFGTLIAVFIAFGKDILVLIREGFAWIFDGFKIKNIPERKFILMIIISTLPLLLVLPIKSKIEDMFSSTLIVGIALLYTACLLFLSDKIVKGRKDIDDVTPKNALIVGVMQAIAVIPGVSRSGSTITSGLFCGFDRKLAVKYSFIMSIPVILGANLVSMLDLINGDVSLGMEIHVCVAGILASIISGIFAIKLVKYITNNDKFTIFAVYTLIVGIITIGFNLIG